MCLAGDEIFLFHQGYEAPGPYELFIASVPQTTDREQQERILGLHQQQAAQHGQDPGRWGYTGWVACGIPVHAWLGRVGRWAADSRMWRSMAGLVCGTQAVLLLLSSGLKEGETFGKEACTCPSICLDPSLGLVAARQTSYQTQPPPAPWACCPSGPLIPSIHSS